MENPRVVIDTDVLVDFLRGNREATSLVNRLEERRFLLATTAINEFELYYGAHKSKEPEKAITLTGQLISKLVVLPLTSKSAIKAGHIYAKLERQGTPIGLRDTLIGAIAQTRDFGVATKNLSHFQKIDGLRLVSI
ncbi:MAG: type II toxin-antitoxin system VapC family toxin [Candidatus Bathyarchaeota archaeon]|nr:type II toxin-antitoxin system VapC family toxin [Candidatus Bathyarchaeota archaeon]